MFQEERCARLEELLNEIMELHQNDIETIKSQVSEQEEIALYQNKDSLRMFRESLNMLDQKVHNLESLQVLSNIWSLMKMFGKF